MARQARFVLFAPLAERTLALVLRRPERAWYRSELARELGLPPSSLQRPLAALLAAGILTARQDGNRVYYQVDVRNPVVPELRALLAKTSGITAVIADALRAHAPGIRVALVYGSVAAGDEVSASDVDLLVVGAVRLRDLAGPLRKAARELGREVNPVIYSEAEFRAKLGERNRFLLAILGRPLLFVMGTEDELAELGRPAPRGAGAGRSR